jgi:Domain of unknown function (DUF4189)
MRRLSIAVVIAGCIAGGAAAQERSKSRGALYGAIAYHAASDSAGWATDRKTGREARIEALKQCGHEACVVVATVSRGCAALAKGGKKFVAQKGATRQEAETKALGKCGAGCEIAVWTCTK